MNVVDSRTSSGGKVDEQTAPKFRPTLAGFQVSKDHLLVELIEAEESSIIARASAYAEPSLYGIVRRGVRYGEGFVVRFLKDVGTKVEFFDTEDGAEFLILDYHDVIGWWDDASVPSA